MKRKKGGKIIFRIEGKGKEEENTKKQIKEKRGREIRSNKRKEKMEEKRQYKVNG